MGSVRLVGKFHYDRAQGCIEIADVFFAAKKVLIRLESSSGTSGRHNRYTERLLLLVHRRASRRCWGVAGRIRTEAGKRDNPVATADIYARNRRVAGWNIACAARTARRRDAAVSVGIGASRHTSLARACSSAGHATARAIAATYASAPARSTQAWLISTSWRQGEQSSFRVGRHSNLRARLARHHSARVFPAAAVGGRR